MKSTRPRVTTSDSELQHRFAPHEVGFDFLPLDVPAGPLPLVPSRPGEPLPVLHLESSGPLPAIGNGDAPHIATAPPSNGRPRRGEFWLDGDTILCACPDCRAPMSVRFWLMVADCWRCGASIELTEEQEREVQRLLAERQRQQSGRSGLPSRTLNQTATPAAEAGPARLAPPTNRADSPSQTLPPQPTAAPRRRVPTVRRELPRRREAWLRHLVSDTPAWLISMLVHMLLLTLLALLTTGEEAAATTTSRFPPSSVARHARIATPSKLSPMIWRRSTCRCRTRRIWLTSGNGKCCWPRRKTPANCGWRRMRRICPM